MKAAAPSSASGITELGIRVARTFSRNRKITITTRTMVISRVISTSFTAARMVWVRSIRTCTLMPGGMLACSLRQLPLDLVHGRDDVGAGGLEDHQHDALARLISLLRLALPGKTKAPIWLFSTPWETEPTSLRCTARRCCSRPQDLPGGR